MTCLFGKAEPLGCKYDTRYRKEDNLCILFLVALKRICPPHTPYEIEDIVPGREFCMEGDDYYL